MRRVGARRLPLKVIGAENDLAHTEPRQFVVTGVHRDEQLRRVQ